jgi:hypothetical protein
MLEKKFGLMRTGQKRSIVRPMLVVHTARLSQNHWYMGVLFWLFVAMNRLSEVSTTVLTYLAVFVLPAASLEVL